jgi:hypothetical protein
MGSEKLLPLLEQALREAAARVDSLQPGRIYCYRCEAASCVHAVPGLATEVFRGYSATGSPQWASLSQVLLDAGHPEVDRLYGPEPVVLALFQTGRDLKTHQLHAFGRASKSYDILGQVVAGYFRSPAPAGAATDGDLFALTIQAVESRGATGEVRLALNVILYQPQGESGSGFLPELLDDFVVDSILETRFRLQEIGERLKNEGRSLGRGARSEILGRVPHLLRDLARSFERIERRQRRRTHHAEERRAEARPVPTAAEEAARSGPEKTLIDEKNGTVIILGRKNRIHVFNADGRHVTSLFMLPEAVERRFRLKRWRPASAEEFSAFQKSLGGPLEQP